MSLKTTVTSMALLVPLVAGFVLRLWSINVGLSQTDYPVSLVVPGAVINGLLVLYLLGLALMSSEVSVTYKVIAFVLLMMGFIIEMADYPGLKPFNKGQEPLFYVYASVSFLIRLFYAIDLHGLGCTVPSLLPQLVGARRRK